jgi:hypothetical protein
MTESTHWADAYAASAPTPHACLSLDELLVAWDESADASARERALAALAECPHCAAIAQIARDLQAHAQDDAAAFAAFATKGSSTAAASAANGSAAAAPRRRPAPRVLRWATAALVVLGVGVTATLWRAPPEPPVVRGATEAAITPASGSRLTAAPPRLQWNAIGSATAYRIELYDERAQSLWRSERIESTVLELPETVRAQLQRGTYLWRVRAEGSDIEIGPFFFRVEP